MKNERGRPTEAAGIGRGSVYLSVVIPAYNERERLPASLRRTRRYLDLAMGQRYEVIVVDDGSTDETANWIGSAASDWPQLNLIRHAVNEGKGAAVRTGMLAARGELLLFQDADGATPIEEEAKLRGAIERGADIAIGSRERCASLSARRALRWLASDAFSFIVRRVLPLRISDTQCGFKVFRRASAHVLFPSAGKGLFVRR